MTVSLALRRLSSTHAIANSSAPTVAAATPLANVPATDPAGAIAPEATPATYEVRELTEAEAWWLLGGEDPGEVAAALDWWPDFIHSPRHNAGADEAVPVATDDPGLFESAVSPVRAPTLVTGFDADEGDRIESRLTDGTTRLGNEPVLWRGTAATAFTATIGQSLALAGTPGDPGAIHVWTFYDTALDRTVLFADRNRDFVVGACDLRLEFAGSVALSPDAFSAGTFFAAVEGERAGSVVLSFAGDVALAALEVITDFSRARSTTNRDPGSRMLTATGDDKDAGAPCWYASGERLVCFDPCTNAGFVLEIAGVPGVAHFRRDRCEETTPEKAAA